MISSRWGRAVYSRPSYTSLQLAQIIKTAIRSHSSADETQAGVNCPSPPRAGQHFMNHVLSLLLRAHVLLCRVLTDSSPSRRDRMFIDTQAPQKIFLAPQDRKKLRLEIMLQPCAPLERRSRLHLFYKPLAPPEPEPYVCWPSEGLSWNNLLTPSPTLLCTTTLRQPQPARIQPGPKE